MLELDELAQVAVLVVLGVGIIAELWGRRVTRRKHANPSQLKRRRTDKCTCEGR
jgi:hypothetical protein